MTSMSHVTGQLVLGAQPDAIADLLSAGITHVINCQYERDDRKLDGADKLQILWLPQADDGTRRDPQQVLDGVAFALGALKQGGKLYVHCAAGVNRAPTMMYAILRAQGLERGEAVLKISLARPQVAFYNIPAYMDSVDAALAWAPR